ncbi:MAG: hypothetical protein ACXADY_16660 [Candidatus Hodarchaeales archaeon]|jgi:hypothetical protein
MIETEKKTIDIEEFSPTEPIYQENVIRHLVRLASLLVIGLLGVSVVLPDIDILSPILIFVLMIVFLAGIFSSFFQLRWINEKRNKSTNLGGTVGLFGLFLTLISSASSLIAIPLAVLIPLLGLGLLLTLVGFFAEMTRIDEPLVFWFRVNLEVIIRYTITITGTLLVNWSALMIVSLILVDWGVLTIFVWPWDLIGGLVIGVIGMVLVWGSWFHQINQTIWRYRVEIVRSIELSVSQGLIVVALIVPFFDPTSLFLSLIFGSIGLAILYLDLYIFKVRVTSKFNKGFVTFGQVIASIIGFILIIIGMIQSIPDSWFFFSIYFPTTGLLLLYRVWFDNINHTVKRTVKTIVWFLQTYYRELITAVALGFIALGSIFPLFLEEVNWFDLVPLGMFLVGYIIGVAIWYKHDYFRGATTTFSTGVLLWGLLASFFYGQASIGISAGLFLLGFITDVVVWRTEVTNAIVQTWKSFVLFLKKTYLAIVQFLQTYYRELITAVALGFITLGSIFPSFLEEVNWFDLVPLGMFLVGYIIGVAIWYKHDYFRGATTTFSTGVLLWGLLASFFYGQASIGISAGLFLLGFIADVVVWRTEVTNAIVQTWKSFVLFLKKTYHAIVQFLQTYYRELITAIALGFIAFGSIFPLFLEEVNWFDLIPLGMFLIGYIIGVAIWYKHDYFRGATTTLSTVVVFWGLLASFFYGQASIIISAGLVLIGVVDNMVVWRIELKNVLVQTVHTIHNFLITVKNAGVKAVRAFIAYLVSVKNTIVQAVRVTIQFLRTYYVEILRYSTTFLGGLFLFTGLTAVVLRTQSGYEVWLIGGGLTFLWIAWFHKVNQFIKQSLLSLGDVIVRGYHTFVKFLIDVKNAIVKAVRSAYLATVAFFHYAWDHRVDIIRAFLTITGSLLIIAPLSLPFFTVSEYKIEPGISILLIFMGLVFLYIAWFRQVNQFVKQSLQALRDAIVHAAHAFYNFLVDVKNAIVKAVRSAYLATVAFFHYTWDHRVDIIRAFLTITGSLLIIAPLSLPFFAVSEYKIEPGISILLIFMGFVFLYIAWFRQVNQFVKQSLQALRDAIVHAAHSFYNFLVDVKNAFVQAFYAIGSFMKKVGNQLEQLFRAAIDLTIPIVLIILAVSVLLYGFILLISGVINPDGDQMSKFFISIPILGDILDFSASIIQGGDYNGNLLGVFVGDPVFLIPLGAALIVVGAVILLFVVLKKENMRLKSLLNSPSNSDSNKGGK